MYAFKNKKIPQTSETIVSWGHAALIDLEVCNLLYKSFHNFLNSTVSNFIKEKQQHQQYDIKFASPSLSQHFITSIWTSSDFSTHSKSVLGQASIIL
jgi:hypothetical protein